jgi:hypothetical protein
MKSEEMAVLRILYKHYGPIKLSALVEGFPDQSKSLVVDAVSRLQQLSYLNLIDFSSVLYVSINRQKRRTVLNLLANDSAGSSFKRAMENTIQINHSSQERYTNTTNYEFLHKPDLNIRDDSCLWIRLPKRSLKHGAAILAISFVILGTMTALNFQSTISSSSIYPSSDEGSPFMFTSNSSPAAEVQKGRNVPVEQAYSSLPALYGVFTKVVSDPLSSQETHPLYYHYLVLSPRQGLLLLGQISLRAATGESNSSLSTVLNNQVKDISST